MKIDETTELRIPLSKFQYDKETKLNLLPENIRHLQNGFRYSDGDKAEKYISNSIKNTENVCDDSYELMQNVKDWSSYYHLGLGRSNILKSLDISRDAEILEIGSGCGAITRYLGENFKLVDSVEGSYARARITRERCMDLENVRVFCSNFRNIKFTHNYDVVTLIGVLEYGPAVFSDKADAKEACLDFINLTKTALREDGILIISIENKIGIKYWSGCPEDHTGVIYDGIYGYVNDKSVITFSKKEIEAILKKAGFTNISFYYCYPDYKFATTIISDIKEPTPYHLHNWIGTPFESLDVERQYTFHEGLAIKTLSDAGLLNDFANSFLIVASQKTPHITNKPDWLAKSFSVKRHNEFRCVTTLKTKPKIYIEKKRLSVSDREEAADDVLKIKHRVGRYDWHKGDLMSFEIFKAMYETDFKRKISDLLKMYYQDMINQFYTGTNDEDGYPLLKGESIDYIFRNILRDEKKQFYIDDEWCVDGYIPADYVLYRCIVMDITAYKVPEVQKKIGNPDGFCIESIKKFFPNYGKNRHNKNKLLEEHFQNLVSGELNKIILTQKFQILRNSPFWNLTKKVWHKLPQNLKYIFKKFID